MSQDVLEWHTALTRQQVALCRADNSRLSARAGSSRSQSMSNSR